LCSQVPSCIKSASLLIVQGVLCLLSHAVLPAIQSYSCLPYGNTIYHLSINLAAMANPLVCYLAFFLPHSSTRLITFLSTVAVLTAAYILAGAIMSPSPPLIVHTAGGVLMVSTFKLSSFFSLPIPPPIPPSLYVFLILRNLLPATGTLLQGQDFCDISCKCSHNELFVLQVLAWILNSASVSYAKLAIATVFRSKGGRGLFLYGIATQAGSAIGSLLIFFLVNFADVFHNYDPCSNT